MVMYKSWEEARDEARAETRIETQANAVLTALRARGIDVSDTARQRILAKQDLAQLERWLEKASVASLLQKCSANRAEACAFKGWVARRS
jgi:post-segregation antitoxin (ccd killing protein)